MPTHLFAVLALSCFSSMASMRMCDAMLIELARSFGVTLSDVSVTVSAFAVAYGLAQLILGPLGDFMGRCRVIKLCTFGAALACMAAALSPYLGWLALWRGVMGAFAAGIVPLAMALIADNVPTHERQPLLAKLLTWTVLGTASGTWFGGFASEAFGWRYGFAIMALLYLLCHVLTPGTGRRQTQNAPLGWSAWRLAMASIFSKWWTLLVLFVVFVEGAAVLGTLTFIPTHIASQTSSNLSRASMVAAMFGAGGIIYSRAVYRLTPLIGTPSMTGIGAGLVALALLGVAICASTAMFAMFCLCAGIGFYMHHNTLQFCATLFSDKARGAGISLFVSTLFLGQAAGISGAAQVMAAYSLQHWIVISAIFMLLLGIIFPVALKRQLTEGNVI